MKATMVILICAICLWFSNASTEQGKRMNRLVAIDTNRIDFRLQVQPILQKNCSPCHFPGGKLYEKLPFDKGETIINHQAAISRRIKKAVELEFIRKYAEQNKTLN